MIVYCTALGLNSSFDNVVGEVATWLSVKLKIGKQEFSFEKEKWFREFGNCHVDSFRFAEQYPRLQSIIFSQFDSDTQGRRWITEIGLRQHTDAAPVEFSLLLKTDEQSTRVSDPVMPTRPTLIRDLMQNHHPAEDMPSAQVIDLTPDSAPQFYDRIRSTERRHPLIIISPNPEGEYLIRPEDVWFQLCGLAEVTRIPVGADTFAMERILTKQYAAWRGAINIIYPAGRGNMDPRNWLYLPDDVRRLVEQRPQAEKELLSIITHRMNLPNQRRHISRIFVEGEASRQRLERERARFEETGEEHSLLEQLYQKEHDSHLQQITELKSQIDQQDNKIGEMEKEVGRLERERDGLRASLHHAIAGRTAGDDEEIRQSLLGILRKPHRYTVIHVLKLCEHIFPDRLVVLPRVEETIRVSKDYKHPDQVLDLMLKLLQEYWECMEAGKGDLEASKVFGNKSFAIKESETVMSSPKLAAARTFDYKGQSIPFWRHLKEGYTDSPRETIRIHFHWDDEDKKIVIGHFGMHLPLR